MHKQKMLRKRKRCRIMPCACKYEDRFRPLDTSRSLTSQFFTITACFLFCVCVCVLVANTEVLSSHPLCTVISHCARHRLVKSDAKNNKRKILAPIHPSCTTYPPAGTCTGGDTIYSLTPSPLPDAWYNDDTLASNFILSKYTCRLSECRNTA